MNIEQALKERILRPVKPADEVIILSPKASVELGDLCARLGVLAALVPEWADPVIATEIAAREHGASMGVAGSARDAARRILREAARGQRRRRLAGELMLPSEIPGHREGTRNEAGLAAMSGIVAEIGAAEHMATIVPVPLADGAFGLAWTPMSREYADITLLQGVMQRLDVWAQPDLLGQLERDASTYCFTCFGAGDNRDPEYLFRHLIREEEFALAGQRRLGWGVTAAVGYQRAHGKRLPAGLRHMLDAVVRSRVSVFVVRARAGAAVVLEDVIDGRTYPMTEHNEDMVYEPGHMALGRLLPRAGRTHLRSMGMVFADWPELPERARKAFAESEGMPIPAELIVETAISNMLGVEVPREVPPTPSRAIARERIEELAVAMDAAPGLAREAPVDDAGVDGSDHRSRVEAVPIERQMDLALCRWLAALARQANSPQRWDGPWR